MPLLLKDRTCPEGVYRPALFGFSFFVACATLVLIAAGGLVTSTESGLSVPDWPLSYGQWFPPMIGGIRFEHTHRMIAGAVGILTFVLAIFLWRFETRASVRILGLAAVGAVLLQAVLGGITVIYLLPKAVSVVHACLAQTFFCIVAVLALVTSRAWIEGAAKVLPEAGRYQRMLTAVTAVLYLQLILGACVRHAVIGAVPHIAGALAVVAIGLLAVGAIEGGLGDFRPLVVSGRAFIVLVMAQIFLGVAAFLATQAPRPPSAGPAASEVIAATVHQAFGALVLATSVLMTVTAFGRLKKT